MPWRCPKYNNMRDACSSDANPFLAGYASVLWGSGGTLFGEKREGGEGVEQNILMNDVNGGNLPEAAVANDNLDGEAGQCSIEGNEAAPATRVKTSYADNRRWCFRCICKIHVEINGRRKPKNVSRIDGQKPRKTSSVCMRCQVALCPACFRPWHEEEGLPPTTPAPGSV
jgi:hypothetical protein